MKNIIILICLVLFGVSQTFAGGSTSFDTQILPILETNKSLADALLNTFDFSSNVWAQVRLGSHTKFGGQRLGPYSVLAKPKGNDGPWLYEVTINTKWIVYDEEGNEIPLLDEKEKKTGVFDPNASRVEESFMSFELKLYDEKISTQSSEPTRITPADEGKIE